MKGAFVRPSTRLAETLAREMSGETSGILLVDFPTGYGKTWAAISAIGKAAAAARSKGKRPRRVIYITPTKVNLPSLEDVSESYEMAGLEAPGPDKVLRFMPIVDMLMDTFRPEETGAVPKRFLSMPEFEDLKTAIHRCSSVREMAPEKRRQYTDLLQSREEGVRRAERAFRQRVSRMLRSADGKGGEEAISRVERIARLKGDPEWQWLGRLYPTTFIDNAEVIVCSVAKFVSVTHTLVDPPLILGESRYCSGAVVIMDEVDAAKGALRDHFIDEASNSEVDLPSMAFRLSTSLVGRDFPKKLTRPAQPAGKSRLPDPTVMLERCAKVADDAMIKAHLGASYKADEGVTKGSFVLYDYEHAILSPDAGVVFNADEGVNSILAHGREDATSLGNVIGTMRGLVGFLQSYLWPLARNYEENRRLSGADPTDFSTESAAASILDHLQLNALERRYVIDGCRGAARMGNGRARGARSGDRSVYARGFNLVSLRDDERHDMATRVSALALQRTPEAFLMSLAERSLVIGLSATARVDSVLCNFDFDYIREQAPGIVRTLPSADMKMLRADYDSANAGYGEVDVSCVSVHGGGLTFDTLRTWLQEAAEGVDGLLHQIEDEH